MFSIADALNVYGLLACALGLLWYYSTATFDHWKKRNVKFKKPIPFFGNTAGFLLLREPIHATFDKLYNHFEDEPYGGLYQLRNPVLMIRDPELIADIFIKDFKHFYDHEVQAFVNFDKDLNPLNGHLFSSEGERWRALRQKMSPIFTSGKLKYMHEQIYGCVRILDESVATKTEDGVAEMDIKKLFQGLTIDVIGTCAFGLTCNATSSEFTKFREMGEKVFKFKVRDIIRFIISVISKKILTIIRLPDIPKDVQDFYLKVVLDTITYRRSRGETRNDALQLLMNLQNTHYDEKYAVSEDRETILKNGEFLVTNSEIISHTSLSFTKICIKFP